MTKILFYSNFCVHSKKFLEYFRNSSESEVFKYICVDRDRRTHQRHPLIRQLNVTCVPTIINNNMKLYGKDAFIWLNDQLQINGVQSVSSRAVAKPPKGIDAQDPILDREKIKYLEIKKEDQQYINTPDADGIKSIKDECAPKRKKHTRDSLKARQQDNKYYQMRKELLEE